VLGDVKELSPHLRQLILNPLKGHTQAARSIHNPEIIETVRELLCDGWSIRRQSPRHRGILRVRI